MFYCAVVWVSSSARDRINLASIGPVNQLIAISTNASDRGTAAAGGAAVAVVFTGVDVLAGGAGTGAGVAVPFAAGAGTGAGVTVPLAGGAGAGTTGGNTVEHA